MRPVAYVGCAALMCCCLSSCAGPTLTLTSQDVPALASDPPQQIPFRAGLFIGRQYEKLNYGGRGALWFTGRKGAYVDVDVRSLFEQAARRMFKEVIPIGATETPAEWRERHLDVVVSIGSITCLAEDQGLRERWPPVRSLIFATIKAKWDIFSADGKLITSTTVAGQGQARPTRTYSASKEALAKAFEAHFSKAYDSFVATAWWRDSSWKTD